MKQAVYRNPDSGEQGVALLFALGILSALMIMGVAFVSSSLFYQNIAVNRRSQHEAAILARSAANRIAAAVMYYQLQLDKEIIDTLKNESDPDVDYFDKPLSADYSALYSISDPGEIGKTTQNAAREFLAPWDNNNRESRLNVAARPGYQGKESSAQWIYIRKPADIAGEIIGRFAYQVLPPANHSRMVYHNVLGGGIDKSSFHKLKYPGSETDRYSKPAWKLRWGQDIAELNLDFDGGIFHEWPGGIDVIAAHYTDFYASDEDEDGFIFNVEGVSGDDKKRRRIAQNKAWFEYWFGEGTKVVDPEAAPGNYCRFYLGPWKNDQDPWYVRFGSGISGNNDKTNDDNIVEQLTELPGLFDYYDESDKLFYDKDEDIKHRGLPFFRRIADDKAAFNELKDRRKQITANFNDYCDLDSVPTSDKKAFNWDLTATIPTYTGNEKTLYINELALALQVDGRIGQSNLMLNITPTVIGEMINMYGSDAVGSDYQFSTIIRDMLAKLKCKFSVDVTITGKDGDSTPTMSKSVSGITLSKTMSAYTSSEIISEVGKLTVGTDKYLAVATTSPTFASTTISDSEIEQSSEIQAEVDAFKDAHPGATDIEVSCKVTDIAEIEVSDISFKLDNMLLKATIGGTGHEQEVPDQSQKVCGVDYVRTPAATALTVKGTSSPALGTVTTSLGTLRRGYCFVGGIEAKDPRQNLNLTNSSGAGDSDDWEIDAQLDDTLAGAKATITGTAPSASSSNLDTLLSLTGGANSKSSPLNSSNSKKDPESTSDITEVSTAVIRNAPMLSPWELGWIHRGAPFETINLKRAGGFGKAEISFEDQRDIGESWDAAGTAYSDGDGGILDWIKFTQDARSFGKIDLNCFNDQALKDADKLTYDGEEDLDLYADGLQYEIATALFNGLRVDEKPEKFISDTAAGNTPSSGSTADSDGSSPLNIDRYGERLVEELKKGKTGTGKNVYRMRSEALNIGKDPGAGETDSTKFSWFRGNDDAAQEELIGKTIALLGVSTTPENIFRAVIIAQTISDVGGDSIDDGVSVRSSDHPDDNTNHDAKLGDFDMGSSHADPRDNLHFDVITGECKILVTYERDRLSGKIRIRRIENID